MNPSKKVFARIALLTVLASSATFRADAAETLFGVTYAGATPLYTVNQTAGTFSVIGPTGFDNVGDLTSDTRLGEEKIYGVRITSNQLLTLDPVTGAGTALSTFTAVTGGTVDIISLALNPIDGRLYGNTSIGFGAAVETLFEINPITGLTTAIGPIGFNNVFALGFDQGGTLFGVSDVNNDFIRINAGTGAGTLVATLSVGLELDFDLASRPSDNVMFLTEATGSGSLYTINTATGATTLVGPEGVNNAVGLAFLSIPEPSTWAAGAAALGFLGFASHRRSLR